MQKIYFDLYTGVPQTFDSIVLENSLPFLATNIVISDTFIKTRQKFSHHIIPVLISFYIFIFMLSTLNY